MNTVDSYITELNDQQQQQPQQQLPIRSHSLQQQGSRPPLSSQRANTTHNYPVSLSLPIIMDYILIIHYETKKKKTTYTNIVTNGMYYSNNQDYVNTVYRNNSAHSRMSATPSRHSAYLEGSNKTMVTPDTVMYPGYDMASRDYVDTYLSSAGKKKQHEKKESYSSTIMSRNSSLFSLRKTRDSQNTVLSMGSNKTLAKLPPPINTTQVKRSSSKSSNATPTTANVPEYACLSVLSKVFLVRIRSLENVRDLFCANEYPESFTGQEAIVGLYIYI
jgi:hypothetical protein